MRKCRLILIPESSICDIGDFHAIAENIRRQAPEIRVHVVKRRHLWWRQLAYLFSPSLYVAFYEAKCFQPIRGHCLHGEALDKSEQYVCIEKAGFEVIPWQPILAGENYRAHRWGNVVIVKPDYGSEGRGVHLAKPEDVIFDAAAMNGQRQLIQKFIETGDHPCYFRALTLFGETLYLRKTTNTASQLDLGSTNALPDPVANAAHGRAELVNDAEVIAFAKRIANQAFSNIPLLGQDIIRDQTSGQLFCLEVNPYGSTWHFSTATGRKLQKRDNIHYQSQFDAFDLAARVLIEKTLLLAS